MPFNGSGSFNRIFSWVADRSAGIFITASRMDSDTNDIVASGLGNCLTRDGQGAPSANLPMAGFRHLNVANAQNRNEYQTVAQAQDGGPLWGGTSTGAANIYAITLTPPITAYVAGQVFRFFSHQANTGAAVLSGNGLANKSITKNGGAALAPGDIPNAAFIQVGFDGTQFELQSPLAGTYLPSAGGTLTGNLVMSGAAINETSATLASAASVAIGAAGANYIFITGNTTITGFDTVQSGTERTLEFQGAAQMTAGPNLILGQFGFIVPNVGDTARFRSEGGGVWRLTDYFRANGLSLFDIFVFGLFVSSGQTITSGGALTIAHGIGAMPTLIQARLHCLTAEAGYSAGDDLIINPHQMDVGTAASRGLVIVPDATNLNIRFGSNANAFEALNKGTGTAAALTNANWQLVLRAWA